MASWTQTFAVRFVCVCRSCYLFRAFLVIGFSCHCEKCNDKMHTLTLYTRFCPCRSVVWSYRMRNTIFQCKKKHTQNPTHFHYFIILSLNVIQSSNCFRFTFFVSLQVSNCSSFNYNPSNLSIHNPLQMVSAWRLIWMASLQQHKRDTFCGEVNCIHGDSFLSFN